MPTIKKLQFANGTVVTEPVDLSLESSTNKLETYADDAAYVAANGPANDGDIYINTTSGSTRLYVNGQWWTAVIKEDAIIVDTSFALVDNGDGTKKAQFDVSNVAAGTTKTYAVPAISTSSDVLVTKDATQELKNKTIDGNFNTLTNLDFGTLSGEVNPQNGGTGISNPAGATLTRTGAFDLNITCTAETDVTMPVSGTLATLGDITTTQITGTLAPAKGGLGTDASAFNGVVKADGAGNFSASSVTNADISATAAIAYSKLSIAAGDIDATKIGTGIVDNNEFNKLNLVGSNGPGYIVSTDGTQTLSNKLMLEAKVDNFLDFYEEAKPATPGGGLMRVYAKSDKKLYKLDDTGVESEIGAGGAGTGRNYLQDWYDATKVVSVSATTLAATANRATDQSLWARSTVAGLTIENNAVSPLRQAGDFLVNSSASTIASFVESPLFAIDSADLGKPLSVEFDITGIAASTSYDVVVVRYNNSGTYQETISVAGNASTGTPASAQLPTATTKFRGFFIPSATSTDLYGLRLRKVAAVDDDFQIDSLFVGPQSLAQGAVVTAFTDSLTPSGGWFVTGPTNVTTTVKQARAGTEAHLKYAIIATGTSASFSELSINLPANLTVDTTAINRTSSGRAPIGRFELTKPGVGNYTGVVYYEGTAFVCRYLGSTAIPSSVGNTGPVNWDTTTAATSINIDIIIPISQWSSGTTTLATRAVEEYAWNSSTSTTSDTTSFGNGPQGVAFTAMAPTGNNSVEKRVRFQTPILPTDSLILETNNGVNWSNASDSIGSYVSNDAGTASYGQLIRPVSGSTTDVSVLFFSQSTGYTNWSAIPTWKWRLRKVSGGASVGFPVSARNIVGDTSGTAVPSGYVGEEQKQVILRSAQTGFTSGSIRNITTSPLVLTSGTWEISANTIFESGSGDTSTRAIVALSNSSATLPASADTYGSSDSTGQITAQWAGSMTNSIYSIAISPYRVIVQPNSTVTLWSVGRLDHSGGSANIYGSIRAIRIA